MKKIIATALASVFMVGAASADVVITGSYDVYYNSDKKMGSEGHVGIDFTRMNDDGTVFDLKFKLKTDGRNESELTYENDAGTFGASSKDYVFYEAPSAKLGDVNVRGRVEFHSKDDETVGTVTATYKNARVRVSTNDFYSVGYTFGDYQISYERDDREVDTNKLNVTKRVIPGVRVYAETGKIKKDSSTQVGLKVNF